MTGEFGLRQNLPYLNGVYVAISAISDARLVVDGPFCVPFKAEVQCAHDTGCTLISRTGPGRIVHTDIRFDANVVYNAAIDRGPDIVRVLAEVSALDGTGLVLFTAMDLYHVVATPMERYRRKASAQVPDGAPIVLLEARSLEGDWLDGYARVLDRVAEAIPLPAIDPAPERVALVGHLMDRNEGDQLGNVQEMRRLLTGLGLEVVSVWLDGGPLADLQAVQRAGTIVSMPYGRAAARRLAERLGAGCVEVDLPLGLGATTRFLEAVGAATGRSEAARALVDTELREVVPRVSPLVFRFLSGRTAIVVADPNLAMVLPGLLGELGVEVRSLAVHGAPGSLDERGVARLEALGGVFEPEQRLQSRGPRGLRLDWETEADLVITHTLMPHDPVHASWVPFGYPNYLVHPTTPRPFLGFAGLHFWVETLVEAAQRSDLRKDSVLRGGETAAEDRAPVERAPSSPDRDAGPP